MMGSGGVYRRECPRSPPRIPARAAASIVRPPSLTPARAAGAGAERARRCRELLVSQYP